MAVVALAGAQVDPNRTVLVVNGEEIKGAEYYSRMEMLSGVGRIVGNQFAEAPPGLLAMQRLIEERVLLQLARERNVAPTETEIQAELKRRTHENPKLLESVKALGLTEADLQRQIRLELSEFKLQTQGITITDIEVEKFYRDNPTLFTLPRRYKLRVIAVRDDQGKKTVDEQLRAGKPFADVAKEHSVEASRGQGGDLGTLPIGMLSENTRKALEASRIGQTTGWLQGEESWAKFLIEGIEPEKKQELDAKLRRSVRQRLMLDRGRVRNDVGKLLREAMAKAKVEVKQAQFAEPLRRYQAGFTTTGTP